MRGPYYGTIGSTFEVSILTNKDFASVRRFSSDK